MEIFRKIIGQSETLKSLSGKQATNLLLMSVVVGIGMAVVEFFFAFYLQNYFSRLGLVTVPTSFETLLPQTPITALFALLAIGLARFIFQSLKLYNARLAQQSFSNTQRSRIIEYHLRQSRLTSAAETLSLFNDEVQRGSLAFMNLSYFFIALASSIVLFLTLILTESYAAALSLIFLGFLYVPTKLINRLANQQGKDLSSHWSQVNTFFIDGIRNNFYLRLYNKIDSTIESSHKYLNLYLDTFKKTFAILSIKATFPAFIGLLLVAVVGYLQIEVLKNDNPGALLIFFYLFLRFSQEASTALTGYSEFMLHSRSLRNILDWYRKMQNQKTIPFENPGLRLKTAAPFDTPITSLACQNISFTYEKDNPIINNLSFNINRGECLAIMGPSGSGKSTLLSLLLGLEKPLVGAILINGSKTLNELGGGFYDRVGYVGPAPFLISGTVRDNLLYAHPAPTSVEDTVLMDALKLVFLDDLIASFPNKLDKVLDEEGAAISSGQKQRIMFARALIRKPDILILDEATSNLDADLDEKILENLKMINANMIMIAVSHRESFKKISTQVLNF